MSDVPGPRGKPGRSAYDIAVEKGFGGTPEQWLASLRGAPGEDGVTGKSAYELALEHGFTGSLDEWLVSLRGKDGESVKGDPGKDGLSIKGDRGESGLPGRVGKAGANGLNGWTPILAAVEDGVRVVLQVADWVGGMGEKPESGVYIGASGYTHRISQAKDIRGPAGPDATPTGASDAGLRKLIERVSLGRDEILSLIEAATMEDFDQVPLDNKSAGSDDEILTFTFDAPVHKVWVKLLASSEDDTSSATVRVDGGDPDEDTGQPIDAGVPQPIAVVTSEVRVYTPAGKTVSVTGYRRRS